MSFLLHHKLTSVYLHCLVDHLSWFIKSAIRVLLGDEPVHGLVDDLIVHEDVVLGLYERFEHKCREPRASGLVSLSEHAKRTVFVAVRQLALVSCREKGISGDNFITMYFIVIIVY